MYRHLTLTYLILELSDDLIKIIQTHYIKKQTLIVFQFGRELESQSIQDYEWLLDVEHPVINSYSFTGSLSSAVAEVHSQLGSCQI